MKLLVLLSLISMTQIKVHALEVVKPEHNKSIELKIVRAEPESFETYSLMNHNGREMILICAKNRVYDDNAKAMIEYRNYYNVIVGYFTIEDDNVCKDMGRFIEAASSGISESKPFLISLNPKTQKVDKIVYPKINIYDDEGTYEDLLPKAPVFVKEKVEKPIKPLLKRE
jgi:hypothetical protein